MGRLQTSVGLVTGTNIQSTVDQLIAFSGQPRDRLQAKIAQYGRQQNALAELTASVIGVQIAGKQLSNADVFQARKATSSNVDALSVKAASSAATGSYEVRTVQLAATHTAQSQRGFASSKTPLGVSGKIEIAAGGFLEQTTSLSELNQGRGVERGSIRITDRAGNTADVNLSKARTIDDVIDTINSTSGIRIRATADADRISLEDLNELGAAATSNLRVEDIGQSETAADLGLYGINVAADVASGADLNPPNSSTARLTSLASIGVKLGTSSDLKVSLKDGSSLSLDLNPTGTTAPTTVGELIDAINAKADGKFTAALSAEKDRIVFQDLTTGAGTFSLSDGTGAAVASSLRVDGDASSGEIASRSFVKPLRGTALEDLGGGSGLGPLTTLDLQTRDGATASVDLSNAKTIQQVTDAINASGLQLSARLDDSGTGLRLRDLSGGTTANFKVDSSDATASTLGIASDSEDTIVDGRSLNRQFIDRSTSITALNQGRGPGVGSFTITDSLGKNGAVNLGVSQFATVGELIDGINALAIDVEAKINERGDGIQLVDKASGSGKLKVVDFGAAGVAKALGILGEAKTQTIDGESVSAIVGGELDSFEFTATDTLDSIVSRINETSRFATASIITDDTGLARLQLLSKRAGDAGRLSVDSTAPEFTIGTTSRGQNALVSISTDNGPERFLSSVDGVITDDTSGLSLTLKQLSEDSINITVERNPDTVTKAAQTIVDQYNKLVDKLTSLTFFNAETQEVGLLFGTSEALRINLNYGQLLSGQVRGAGSIKSFSAVGIRLNDQGKLTLDANKLVAAIEKDPNAVTEFFTKEDTGAIAQLEKLSNRIAGANSSLLINRTESLGLAIQRGNERVASMNKRLDNERTRLLRNYNASEVAIARLQANQSALDSIQSYSSITGNSN